MRASRICRQAPQTQRGASMVVRVGEVKLQLSALPTHLRTAPQRVRWAFPNITVAG
jgi:hypothetical protein